MMDVKTVAAIYRRQHTNLMAKSSYRLRTEKT